MLVGTTFSIILGQMIKVLREMRSNEALSQGDLATVINVSVMSISRLEKGDAEMTVPEMERFALFFEITPEKFLAVALQIKGVLVQQKCVVLQNKHELKALSNFKKLDRMLIHDLCRKFLA